MLTHVRWQAWVGGKEQRSSSIAVTLTHIIHIGLGRQVIPMFCYAQLWEKIQTPGKVKLRLPIPWQCRRVSFTDCVHARGHSPGRASTCSYRRKVTVWRYIWLIFFYVLSYVGEDSTTSDALGPRSKIMLISNMLSLEATSRKSKVLDILLFHLGT